MTTVTIRMPKALLTAWLAALRSGDYKQARGALRVYDNINEVTAYCCLGVLEMVSGDPECPTALEAAGVPSFSWLNKHDIEFYSASYMRSVNPALAVSKDGVGLAASYLNDTERLTFSQIADLIEYIAEGT